MPEFLKKVQRQFKSKPNKGYVLDNNSNNSNESDESDEFFNNISFMFEGPLIPIKTKKRDLFRSSEVPELNYEVPNKPPIQAHGKTTGAADSVLDKIKYALGLKSRQRGLIIQKGTEPIMASVRNRGFFNKIMYALGLRSKQRGVDAANLVNQLIINYEKTKTS